MKKLRGIALFLFLIGGSAPVVAKADLQSEALLTTLRAKIGSYTSYRIHFEAVLGEDEMVSKGTTAAPTMRGTITIHGAKFAATMPGQVLYYDGATLWNYLPAEQEVTVERLDQKAVGGGVLSNPTRLLYIDPADYAHRMLPSAGGLHGVELVPRVPVADYEKLELYLNPSTMLPVRMVIFSEATPKPIELQVKRIETNFPVSTADFQFDTGKYPEVEVIDFR